MVLKATLATLVSTALLLPLLGGGAGAYTYFEQGGDAGETPTDFQNIAIGAPGLSGGPGSFDIHGNISAIDQTGLGTADADVYAITLTAGQTFTATTTAATDPNNTGNPTGDTNLSLFDSEYRGVAFNQNITNDPDNPFNSNLNSQITFTPTVSGTYYLGVGYSGYLPYNTPSNQYVFGLNYPLIGTYLPPPDQQLSWDRYIGDTSSDTFAYTVALEGAAPTPEPAVGGGLLAIGALGLVAGRKRKARAKQTS